MTNINKENKMKKPKRGRIGIPLSREMRREIFNIMDKHYLSYGEIAIQCGLTQKQIQYPMSGKGRCSKDSFEKIRTFIDSHAE